LEIARSELPFRFALHASSALITGTPTMAEWYSKRYHVRRSRIHIVPNDVDVSAIPSRTQAAKTSARQRLGLPLRPKLALVVQRLSPVRRTLDYLPHLAETAASHQGWEIAVIGGGPDLRTARDAVSRGAFHGVVRMVGPVLSADIGDWYAAADAFVLPSHAEGFPRVLIEAMAWSLPIVTTDAGGVRDLMPPWATGVIAARDKPKELAATFENMIAEKRLTEGRRYRKWAERFDTVIAVESLDAILRRYDASP
jgi:glycosyltransferase involved in cell wall biosynthesis